VSDGLTQALLGVSIVLLLAVQILVKPGFDPAAIRAVAESLGGPSEWDGRIAPDFDLPLRDGSIFRLSEHVGREVVVLNFFATWCVPCRDEMPELQRYARQHAAPSGFVLIGVDAAEQPDQVDAFVLRHAVGFPAGIDATNAVGRAYGINAYPTTVLIGADGRIRLYQRGAISNAEVAFGTIVPREVAALSLPGHTNLPPRTGFVPPPDPANAAGLSGRALAIAEAMPCPCGCEHLRVVACSCQTARAIKAKLRAGVDGALTDGQIMETLNKEFCMKGM
jgi:peroxiredoxin